MKACVISKFGGHEVLEIRDVELPQPGPGEVLVKVRASALNRADILQRMGKYAPPQGVMAEIPGIEFAGEVVELAGNGSRWRAGDRVFGVVAGGAHAEFLVTHESLLAPVPKRMDWVEAGAVPEAFMTAHDALISQAGLHEEEYVLIHAVGSGVGLAAAQIVKAWGAHAFGTSRTADKLSQSREYGMEEGFLATSLSELGASVSRWSGDHGVDVVLDLLGGPYVAASIEAAALQGRIMLVGAIAGSTAQIDVRRVLSKRLTLRGTVLRPRTTGEKAGVTEAFARDLLPLLDSGALVGNVDSVFPLHEMREAHKRMESNETFGKVVITV